MTVTTTEELRLLASSDNTNELTRRLARECLANREEQPVAYLNKFSGVCMTLEQQPNAAHDAAVYVPLYLAPPAPAMLDALKRAVTFYEQVKRENTPIETGAWKDAVDWVLVEACRAAMLAQPVSSGYKLPGGWMACSEQMPELDKQVLLYFGSYDGHIEDGCIGDDGDGPYHYFFDGDSLQQEPTHWMPLPAAPEGGNG